QLHFSRGNQPVTRRAFIGMSQKVKKTAVCCGATLALLPFAVIGVFFILNRNTPDAADTSSCMTNCHNKFSAAASSRQTRSAVKSDVNPSNKRYSVNQFLNAYFEGVEAGYTHTYACRDDAAMRCYASCPRNNFTDLFSQYSILLDKYCSMESDNETVLQFWDQLTEANAQLRQHFIDCGKKNDDQVVYERNATESEIICKYASGEGKEGTA
ncbi:hypothetical protein AAVH_23860, partial [Aphelenchoides avenae]